MEATRTLGGHLQLRKQVCDALLEDAARRAHFMKSVSPNQDDEDSTMTVLTMISWLQTPLAWGNEHVLATLPKIKGCHIMVQPRLHAPALYQGAITITPFFPTPIGVSV
jgi:hypothetical protein